MRGGLKRQRSLNDAASALVGLASPPEPEASARTPVRQRLSAGTNALGTQASAEWNGVGGSSVDSACTAIATALGSSLSDDDGHRSILSDIAAEGGPPGSLSSPNLGAWPAQACHGGVVHGATLPQHPQHPPPPSDTQLLTSAAVLLATCGLVHALNVSTEAASSEAGGSAMASSSSSPTQDDEPRSTGTSPCRAARLAPPGGAGAAHEPFSESVWLLLRQECAHVRALDRPDFARLCQMLDLPLETGVDWQARILSVQHSMREQAERTPLPPRRGGANIGECASAAAAAFKEALTSEERAPSRAFVRRFGRQTVWCTVALLRRVLREASWREGDRCLTSAQAEARLASLAVAAIGGKEP